MSKFLIFRILVSACAISAFALLMVSSEPVKGGLKSEKPQNIFGSVSGMAWGTIYDIEGLTEGDLIAHGIPPASAKQML